MKEYKDKFIAFIDILGFKEHVEESEAGKGVPLSELIGLTKKLGTLEDQREIETLGPLTCPSSRYMDRNLDFKITQVSDCVVVSAEISPAGIINLVKHCWTAVFSLLIKGFMCRGYITRGSLYHEADNVIGSGYQNAYKKESQVTAFKSEADERGTPFVEIDPVVCEYVRDHGDNCVKEMFSRFTCEDDDVTALFPFKRLSHDFIIGGFPPDRNGFGHSFDPNKEKLENQKIRSQIQKLIELVNLHVNKSKEDAVRKAGHYIRTLETQLRNCDETDKIIDDLVAEFPAGRMKDITTH